MNPQNSAVQAVPQEAPQESPFYISATRMAAGAPRTLKCGDTFIVIDSRGDIAAASGRSAGLFHQDTRYLSRLELFINDTPPLLLGSNRRNGRLLRGPAERELVADKLGIQAAARQ